MSITWLCAIAIAFGVLGGATAWLTLRTKSAVLRERVFILEQALGIAREELKKKTEGASALGAEVAALNSTLEQERRQNAEKLALVMQASEEMRTVFKALAADALKSNNQSFLDLAKANLEKFQSGAKLDMEARQAAIQRLVSPIAESLGKVEVNIREIEKERVEAYGILTTQVQSLVSTQEQLRNETGNLVRALRTPTVRGRWGEIQLKRVVEIAGMLPYCDFVEQVTIRTEDGRLRPDLVVNLPGGKNIVVDAKTPLDAYLRAVETNDDEVRRTALLAHAQQVRTHMDLLSSKAYWQQFEASPEFVVMFLPGETFFSAALEQDPALIEEGVNKKVIPASPTTLISLLRAVAYGWRQEKLARNAQEISALGKELHDRLRNLAAHLDSVGKGLDRAVECYNKAVGTLESRVMVSARKFAELGAPISEEIPEMNQIETTTRTLALEWDESENIGDLAASTESAPKAKGTTAE